VLFSIEIEISLPSLHYKSFLVLVASCRLTTRVTCQLFSKTPNPPVLLRCGLPVHFQRPFPVARTPSEERARVRIRNSTRHIQEWGTSSPALCVAHSQIELPLGELELSRPHEERKCLALASLHTMSLFSSITRDRTLLNQQKLISSLEANIGARKEGYFCCL